MRRLMLFSALAVLIAAPATFATRDDDNRYGIGLQWVDPVAYGPSFTMDLFDLPMSIQGVLGLNDFPAPVARVRYVFAGRRYLDGYAYGAIGAYDDDGRHDEDDGLRLFAGVGAGVEWDWRDADESLPPISWSLELGLNDTDLSFGFGVHYTF
ncbi:hypothetical protein KQI52_02750 [bacterium]|nr:hypothetical protein [bacterium]